MAEQKVKTKKKIDKLHLTLIIVAAVLIVVCIIIGIMFGKKRKQAELNQAETEEASTWIDENELDENIIEEDIFIESEEEETEEVQEEQNKKTETYIDNSSPYYIKVNSATNCLTVYSKDGNGNYTNPIKAMICSTGSYTPPNGKYPGTKYKIPGTKWEWGYMQGDVWAHYVTKITGNILFHSVPYTGKSPDTLEYWEYDKLGTSASLGCIRLRVVDSKWIFDNIPGGTYVEFYSDGNPGPLGKPSAQKISPNETCRNWDPTDPNPNNPWKSYKEPAKETVKKTETKEEETKETKTEEKKTETDEAETKKTDTKETETKLQDDSKSSTKTNTSPSATATDSKNTKTDETNKKDNSSETKTTDNKSNSGNKTTTKTNTNTNNEI